MVRILSQQITKIQDSFVFIMNLNLRVQAPPLNWNGQKNGENVQVVLDTKMSEMVQKVPAVL
jgi:hypothetical protein